MEGQILLSAGATVEMINPPPSLQLQCSSFPVIKARALQLCLCCCSPARTSKGDVSQEDSSHSREFRV